MWPFRNVAAALGGKRASVPPPEESVLRDLLADARKWIVRYAGPRHDLDDLVQEAMVELVVALDAFRGDSSLRTYAHRIVLRTTARELAKRRNHERRNELVLVDAHEDTRANPERALLDQEALRHFYDALGTLSPKRRNAFVLCAIERLAHEEAARIEEVSVDTLRARLKHARSDLEALVKEDPLLAPYLGDAP